MFTGTTGTALISFAIVINDKLLRLNDNVEHKTILTK